MYIVLLQIVKKNILLSINCNKLLDQRTNYDLEIYKS